MKVSHEKQQQKEAFILIQIFEAVYLFLCVFFESEKEKKREGKKKKYKIQLK
jgi:hypothetical protein